MRYRLVIEADAVHALLRRKSAERAYLFSFFESLAADPYRRGRLQERDETGRPIEVLPVGRYLITYWADHAVRELRVVRVERAERI